MSCSQDVVLISFFLYRSRIWYQHASICFQRCLSFLFEFLSYFKTFASYPYALHVQWTGLGYFEIKTVFLDLPVSHILSSNLSRYSELSTFLVSVKRGWQLLSSLRSYMSWWRYSRASDLLRQSSPFVSVRRGFPSREAAGEIPTLQNPKQKQFRAKSLQLSGLGISKRSRR